MQKRGFLVLAGATVVLVAAAVATLATGDRGVSTAFAGTRALPALAPKLADITGLRLSRGAMKADFTRVGNTWLVVGKGNYPADPAKIHQVLLGLADLMLIEPKTDRPALYPRLAVGDPAKGKATLVTATDKSGVTLAALIVGKQSYDELGGGTTGVYVRKPNDPRAWLARGKLDVSGDLAGWLDRRILDIGDNRVAAVVLTAADGTSLAIDRDKPGTPFAVKNPPADAKFKDQPTIAAPAGALATLDLDDVAPAAQVPVPASGVVTAVFTTFHKMTITLRLFRHDNHDWVAVAASGEGDGAAEAKKINDRVGHWVYAIPSYKAKLLQTKLADVTEPAKGS